jgi:hypothetical protein
MRIEMGQVDKCGTFVRDGAGKIALVLGTIEQPDRAQASSYDEIAKFYAAYDPPVRVMPAIEAANTLDFLLGPAAPRTLALRDYYSGWEAVGCQAHGGKPLLLKSSPTELQMFFDGELCTNRCRPSIPHPLPSPFPFPSQPPPTPSLDNPRTDHITSHDAHIIDCRRAADPDAEPLPIAATLGIHLVKAEPVRSTPTTMCQCAPSHGWSEAHGSMSPMVSADV